MNYLTGSLWIVFSLFKSASVLAACELIERINIKANKSAIQVSVTWPVINRFRRKFVQWKVSFK